MDAQTKNNSPGENTFLEMKESMIFNRKGYQYKEGTE